MKIFPAIDLMDGAAVRLTHGDFATKEVFSTEPEAVLERFMTAGAKCLHVVDLDGARGDGTPNFEVISKLCRNGVFVEVGGGVRNRDRVARYLDAGASRVILGTAAVRDFGFLERTVAEFGNRIAVGVDARDGRVAVSGWEQVSDLDAFDFCRRCLSVGAGTVIFTDIATDGAMQGTNMRNFERLTAIDGLNVIASGGVSSLEELRRLKELGVEGVILGKALYKGLIDLTEALRIARSGSVL